MEKVEQEIKVKKVDQETKVEHEWELKIWVKEKMNSPKVVEQAEHEDAIEWRLEIEVIV